MASRLFARARDAARILSERRLREATASIQRSIPLAVVLALVTCAEGGVDSGDALDAIPLRPAAEELRIGSVDDPDLGFSTIVGVAVDAGGRVFVLDAQERRVRVFDRDGEPLRSFGREGRGPGEFQTPTDIGVVGDTVWVADALTGRITLFDPTGTVLATHTPGMVQLESPSGALLLYRPAGLLSDGRIHATFVGTADPVTEPISVPELAVDSAGTATDTLWMRRHVGTDSRVTVGSVELPVPALQDEATLHVPAGELGRYVVERPAPVSSDEAAFRVLRVDPAGDTAFVRSFSFEPVPYSNAAERLEETASDLRRALGPNVTGDRDRVAQTLRSSMEVPEYHVPVSAAAAGVSGSLWLRREAVDAPGHQWLLLDPDGTLRGRTELPAGAMVRSADGDVLWVSVRDELGVPWLVRYRLEG